MATVYQEIEIEQAADFVWERLRDFGALSERLVPGFVTECQLEDEGQVRMVTFFNGRVVRERLVGLDERAMRISYTVLGGAATHHQASAQVFAEADRRARLVWITDVLPDALAEPMAAMMERGAQVMKRTLESASAGAA